MDLGIEGKVALVGASSAGLGLAVAQRLAREGCRVAICGRDDTRLARALEQIGEVAPGAEARAFRVDLTDAQQIEALVAAVNAALGPVEILTNNAGGPPPGGFADTSDEKWELGFRLTFLSTVRLTRLVLPDMRQAQWGRIVNVMSRALREPIGNLMISNAMRLAVGGMAKTLAAEVAADGITVNNVGPGTIPTARVHETAAARAAQKGCSVEEELAATAARIPRGRLGTPEELADAVAFLASDLAGHITGSSLLVDGGETRAL